MKIVFFGNYAPGYSRTHVILSGLFSNKLPVINCNNTNPNIVFRYFHLVAKFLSVKGRDADIIFVGFPGHFDVPLAYVLAKVFKKKLVFDAYISLYNSYIIDRKYFAKNSWRAKIWFGIDWLNCRLSDIILLDTNEHINYFIKTFHAEKKKMYRLFVGSDQKLFHPIRKYRESKLSVGFYGSYLPLQGVPVIIRSAHLLPDVQFTLLGDGPDFLKCRQLASKLNVSNVNFMKPVPYNQLPGFIYSQSILLGGPFGTNEKAGLVIPNKVYESLAMGKPVVVGDSPAIRELLTDKKNCYFVKRGNPKEIALAIRALFDDNRLRNSIARNGRVLFMGKLTTNKIGATLKDILTND